MKAGIIGSGKMGLLHAATLNSLKDVELIAMADTSGFIGKALSVLQPNIQFYKDYKKMLEEEKLDAVFITTPIYLHTPMAMECVKRGIHIFIEKPLSCSALEAEPLMLALQEKEIVNIVGYSGRYYDAFVKAKEILDTGVLGKLFNFTATSYQSQLFQSRKGWRYSKKQSGGGVLNNFSSHVISVLQWFFGDVKSVNGSAESWYSDEVEDYVHANLRFENGLFGWLDSSWSVRNYRLPTFHMEIHGENGDLIVGDNFINLFLEKDYNGFNQGWTKYSAPDLYKGAEVNIGGSQFTREDKEFINAILTGDKVRSDVEQAYKAQCIIDAIYNSAHQDGKTILVDYKGVK